MWKVLVSAPYAMPVIDWFSEQLRARGCEVIVAPVNERLEEAELLTMVADVDGIICGDDRITDAVLAAAPKLKVISKWGTGIDSIDRAAAAKRGIAVRNTPNAFSEPVADTVMGYFLMAARKLDVMTEEIRGGRWVKPQLTSLRESCVGVIGVGNCGKALIRRAHAFGATILGHDPVHPGDDFVASTSIQMTTIDDLLKRADFVSLHTDLNPTSFHLIDARTLSFMKPSAYLVNTSRGPVVDEPALIRALEDGRIAGAALDVFEDEPLPAASPLRRMKNVQLGPHNANSSALAADRVHHSTIKNLVDELQARG